MTNEATPAPSGAFSSETSTPDDDGIVTRHPFRALVGFASWCMLGSAALVVLLRSTNASSVLTIAIVGATTYAAIPVLGGLIGSFISRGRTLRLAAGLLASVFFFVTTPLDAVIGCRPSESRELPGDAAPGADELTILTANVLYSTWDPDALVKMIVDSDADIVSLQEVESGLFAEITADPALADYTYGDFLETDARFATATLARVPIAPRASPTYDRRIATTIFPAAETNPIGREFTLTSLHLNAPLNQDHVVSWQRQLGELAQLPVSEPAVLVGDFNATEDHKQFRNVLAAGWTDVHQEKGCGLDATFPSKERFPVAVMRLDHVLVTNHFEVVSVDVLSPTNGSDHNPVLTNIRLRTPDSTDANGSE